ncbi:MAG: OsmC family protein [Rhodospirillales bacterium]|nr:OsmC family protein [Rhodospirillales bacterium]
MAEVVVQERGTGAFTQDVVAGVHRLTADEPRDAGGDDAGPNPYEYLLAALGACTSMTIRMYVQRKGWVLRRIHVRLRHEKIHARDCAECETRVGMVDQITREIALEGDLDAEQTAKVMEIADKCPVHRTLTSEIRIVTRQAG